MFWTKSATSYVTQTLTQLWRWHKQRCIQAASATNIERISNLFRLFHELGKCSSARYSSVTYTHNTVYARLPPNNAHTVTKTGVQTGGPHLPSSFKFYGWWTWVSEFQLVFSSICSSGSSKKQVAGSDSVWLPPPLGGGWCNGPANYVIMKTRTYLFWK